MDWTGENVAGLIVMKVRDELLLECQGPPSDENTLTQIATDRDQSGHMDTEEHDASPLESTHIQRSDDHISCPASSQTQSYTDAVKSPGKLNKQNQYFSSKGHNTHYNRRSNYAGGRGKPFQQFSPNRGRGRGSGRPYYKGAFSNRRTQDKLSADDKNFLFGFQNASRYDSEGYITPRKTTKSPPTNVRRTPRLDSDLLKGLDLSEQQKQGLIDMGLLPNSDFVRNSLCLKESSVIIS